MDGEVFLTSALFADNWTSITSSFHANNYNVINTFLQNEEDAQLADYDFEYGFGAAKHFMPLPNTVVGSHCAWELRLNTVPNRIPGK